MKKVLVKDMDGKGAAQEGGLKEEMHMDITLGSLFDGSGGFPLAGTLCRIRPIWASEIEPYPIAVTRSRFPTMKHLGDISKIDGSKIEPVDIITFGSPCQGLSIAGLQKGLSDERSGLFLEAIRIIKEMRCATNGKYPKLSLWENVPGALSSNSGEDFRIVLEEFIKIIEPEATMPPAPKGGWPYADAYMGDGWSLAYRTFDAQYWGVPQRRRRIYLVTDFIGGCATGILFKREGLRGDFTQGKSPRQRIAANAERGVRTDDTTRIILDDQGGSQIGVRTDGKCPTLRAEMHGNIPAVLYQPMSLREENWKESNIRNALRAGESKVSHAVVQSCPQSVICKTWDGRGNGDGEIANTITGDHENRVTDYTSVVVESINRHKAMYAPKIPSGCENRGKEAMVQTDSSEILSANNDWYLSQPIPIHDKATRFRGGGPTRNQDGAGNGLGVGASGDPMNTLTSADRHMVAYAMQSFGDYKKSKIASSLKARDYKDTTDIICSKSCQNLKGLTELPPTSKAETNEDLTTNRTRYIIRRLTPIECARLQGFPDTWGKPEYKEDFSEEEYEFWLNVRNTHAAINGKKTKQYTKEQILSWYNKLHSNASEYRMWGNGVALPPTLYCMQGIKEALSGSEL